MKHTIKAENVEVSVEATDDLRVRISCNDLGVILEPADAYTLSRALNLAADNCFFAKNIATV
jgi:hypothetical protein